jgi:hypothetical protein
MPLFRRQELNYQIHDYATRPALLRRAIESHQGWIEQQLDLSLAEAVILDVSMNFAQIPLSICKDMCALVLGA